jgi:hypothetical protein
LKIEIRKNHEAIGVLLPQESPLLLEPVWQLAIHTDANRNSIPIHQLHKSISLFRGSSKSIAKMRMHINDGKASLGEVGGGDL